MRLGSGLNLRGACSPVTLLLALSVAPGAVGQQVSPAQSVEAAETIVVVGQRLANERALEAKRTAAGVTDVIAADDLNKLPDQNAAEAISRAPGVTAFQDEGAGLYVGIRGLNQEFVNVTLDGLELSSASRTFDTNLRGANLEAVPSSFVRRVEIIKSATPDLDGDAIAGTVNLVTRSALDGGKDWLTIGLSGGQYRTDVPDGNAGLSAKGAVSFGSAMADGTFGLVGDASFRRIARDNLKPYAWFGARADARALPEEVGGFYYEREEASFGGNLKLEFRPSDAWQAYVSANYSDSRTDIDKNKHAIFAPVSNIAAGTFSAAQATVRNDDIEYGVDGALTLTGAADWFLDDRNTLSLKGSTSDSTSYQDDPRVDWFYAGPLSGSYVRTDSSYVYKLNDASQALFENKSRYAFNGYRRYQEELEKGVDAARVDWTNSAPDGNGLGFKAGAKWKRTEVDFTASNFRWDRPKTGIDFASFLSVTDYAFPGTNNARVVQSDIASLKLYAEALGAAGFSRVRDAYVNGRDYAVSEDVLAGYALADYAGKRFRVVGGLRYEATRTEASNRLNRAENANFAVTEADYGDLLPSIAATWFVSNNLMARFGASQTIGRPDIRDLARADTPPNDNGIFERGNPDLQPRRSNNFDASLEYYFDRGRSLVSLAVFHKAIKDEIFTLQTPYVFQTDQGALVNSYFIQSDNASEATVSGVEASVVIDRLGFLPYALSNLGLSANVTLNSGDIELVNATAQAVRTTAPEGLSETLANVTLFYEGERVSGRLAHRFVGEQTQQLSIDGSGDLVFDDFQQTDVQLGFNVTPALEVFVEAWNLFGNEQETTNANLVTGNPNWYERVRYGRAFWLGTNITF